MKLLIVLLQFVFLSYNVENLFDTRHDTLKNDYEYCSEGSKKWSENRLSRKIHDVIRVIVAQDDLPAIVGLCEVENDSVLVRMTSGLYSRLNYGFVHLESDDPRGIDVALLFRQDLLNFDTCFLFGAETQQRQMLYARFRTQHGLILHAIQAHLPSRRGGAIQTEHLRIAAASAIRSLTDSLLAIDHKAAILIMGDMNDNPTDKSMTTTLNALTPDSLFDNSNLYNLCATLYRQGYGSYYHQGKWSMLDNIIVSGALLNGSLPITLHPEASLFNPSWLQQKNGTPRRTYKGDWYNGGVSDHFPVTCGSK